MPSGCVLTSYCEPILIFTGHEDALQAKKASFFDQKIVKILTRKLGRAPTEAEVADKSQRMVAKAKRRLHRERGMAEKRASLAASGVDVRAVVSVAVGARKWLQKTQQQNEESVEFPTELPNDGVMPDEYDAEWNTESDSDPDGWTSDEDGSYPSAIAYGTLHGINADRASVPKAHFLLKESLADGRDSGGC